MDEGICREHGAAAYTDVVDRRVSQWGDLGHAHAGYGSDYDGTVFVFPSGLPSGVRWGDWLCDRCVERLLSSEEMKILRVVD